MRKLGILLLMMAIALLSVVYASDYSVQYYYGGYHEKTSNFGIGLYYGSIKYDDGVISDTYSGIGAKLFYRTDTYRVFVDYFSGKDGVDLKEFKAGVGYVFYKSEMYHIVADLLYRNIDNTGNIGNINAIGLKVSLGSPITEDQAYGYHLSLIWYPSYSANNLKSFGWEVGLSYRLAQNWIGCINYSGERFTGNTSFNYNTFKIGFAYKF